MIHISADPRSVARRVIRAFGANAYEQLVTVIVQLAGVPVLLHAWGAQQYGEWLMLAALPSYLSLSGLGLSQSASNDMTARVARGDFAGAAQIHKSLFALMWGITAIALILCMAAIAAMPLNTWLHLTHLDAHAVQLVAWCLAAEALVAQPNGVTHSGFRASGQEALHVSVTCTVRLLQHMTVWIAALIGYGPLVAAAAFLLVRVVGTVGLATYLARRHPWLRASAVHFSVLKGLVRPALANLTVPLGQAVNVQGMVLVVGAVLGPVSVVAFSTARTLTRLTVQVVAAVSNAVEPELARSLGRGDRPMMKKLFLHLVRTSLWLALSVALGLLLFGPQLLVAWTRGKLVVDTTLFGFLVSCAAASVLWFGAFSAVKSANAHLRASMLYLLSSGAAVAVGYAALRSTQLLWTAGASLLVVDALMSGYAMQAAVRLIGVRGRDVAVFALNPITPARALLRRTFG